MGLQGDYRIALKEAVQGAMTATAPEWAYRLACVSMPKRTRFWKRDEKEYARVLSYTATRVPASHAVSKSARWVLARLSTPIRTAWTRTQPGCLGRLA